MILIGDTNGTTQRLLDILNGVKLEVDLVTRNKYGRLEGLGDDDASKT